MNKTSPDTTPPPATYLSDTLLSQTPLRAAITRAYRLPEPKCLPALIPLARQGYAHAQDEVQNLARELVQKLRKKGLGSGVDGLIHEYSLSSQEGIALMCLAEALLRIPDAATRDALIRDKISQGEWKKHLNKRSMFVSAATWGLMLTGRLVSTSSEEKMDSAIKRLLAKGGEPLIRRGVNMAMRLMGEHFVCGESIHEALKNARTWENKGFTYSYDMLGEAAMTHADAEGYYKAYESAIHAIGQHAAGQGLYRGAGISIKLSALHPRYERAQYARVMDELLPRVKALTMLAREYDIGLNIDAEEADRLEISLDILEALCQDPDLAGWNGIGFVIQAYQKRAPYVIDYVTDLGRRTEHRLMIRLVKGAYWDTEIKNAQVEGLDGYPVFTRKVYTDVSYLACAHKLLSAPDAVFPQFATHNAHTLAAIYHMAGPDFSEGQYEFQCLHGMGEPLYEEVVGPQSEGKLARPCRIYAPVGTHKTLLAYLVRRLLENGANSSFVNRIADEEVSIAELIRDPIQEAESIHPLGEPHPMIPLPRDLYRAQGEPRANSKGTDLSDEQTLRSLSAFLLESSQQDWTAQPTLVSRRIEPQTPKAASFADRWHDVRNPANHLDIVGQAMFSDEAQLQATVERAATAMESWQHTTAQERAQLLLKAADLLEERQYLLIGLIVREAGKTYMNAINEIREAVDFLRYYAKRSVAHFDPNTHRPLGPVACISPWNFPLAIFLGQVSAALAAGNTVIAKPAEQTTLIGAQGVQLLHDAGFPGDVIQLLPGAGDIGAALVDNAHIQAVMFTGSTEVAQSIAGTLSKRPAANGQPIPLIAETGGLNTLIVDSSALPEQVTADVLDSAFDSAGQRCSALRILCIQEDVADTMLTMITGAMHELTVANPDRLDADVGPVIDNEAQETICTHIESMRTAGFRVEQTKEDPACEYGTFVPPTLIHIDDISDVKKEIFGPVLHVLTYQSQELDTLVDKINAAGYGLTFGVHSRIDEHIDALTQRIQAGNIYVNRNIVGAIVGVQPFGGEGLSGTGPKAGGPLYLNRLLSQRAEPIVLDGQVDTFSFNSVLASYVHWLERSSLDSAQQALPAVQDIQANSLFEKQAELPGPTGELNIYRLVGRGTVVCLPATEQGLLIQIGTALATGNDLILCAHQGEALSAEALTRLVDALPESVQEQISFTPELSQALNGRVGGVLFEGAHDELNPLAQKLAAHPGPILQPQGRTPQELSSGQYYRQELLLAERALSINTAAAGGNATLMAVV